jgi:hypothetical protein
LDKSQGAGYSGGSFTGENLIANGDGSTVEGWTVGSPVSFSVNGSNQFEIARNSGAATDLPQQSILTVGKFYQVSFDVIARSNDVSVYAGEPAPIGSPNVFITSTTGSFSVLVKATGTDFHIGPTNSFTATCTIDNISVRELPGNHATQTTFEARPILARVPETGRRNLLERTEEFDQSPWTGAAGVSQNSTVAPDGTTTADTLTDSGGSFVNRSQPLAGVISAGVQYVASVYVLKTTGAASFPGIMVYGAGSPVEASITVDTDSGSAVVRSGANAATDISVVEDGSYWRVSFAFTFTTIGASPSFSIYPAVNTDASNTWSAAATGSVVVWGAQLEEVTP